MEIEKENITKPIRSEGDDSESTTIINSQKSEQREEEQRTDNTLQPKNSTEYLRILKEGIEISSAVIPVNEIIAYLYQMLENKQIKKLLGISVNSSNKDKKNSYVT